MTSSAKAIAAAGKRRIEERRVGGLTGPRAVLWEESRRLQWRLDDAEERIKQLDTHNALLLREVKALRELNARLERGQR